ncbi:MAG: Malonyl CoA-acyl carrier protein transacylase [Planctomycetota bacterium]|jgi:[acyl-carrier-protein] S-malonyltransferase
MSTQVPAILFPGQGAQYAGMGRDWCEAYPEAQALWSRADAALGFSLSDACWNQGETVNRTDIAQPGIFTTSAAIVTALHSQGLDLAQVPLVAGLSLGEYTALWAAGALSFEDGVRLVRLRGEAMQAAAEQIPSSMTSLMGATEEQAAQVAAHGARFGICQVANLNAPGQVVIAGELAALDAAEAAAKDYGVRRTRRLVVAGGFHSECMRPAAERLKAALAKVEIRSPRCTFLTNVTGGPLTDPDEIRTRLAEQVCSSVLWERSMRTALAMGHKTFLEPGPGTVLAGILSKIDETAQVTSAAKPDPR